MKATNIGCNSFHSSSVPIYNTGLTPLGLGINFLSLNDQYLGAERAINVFIEFLVF